MLLALGFHSHGATAVGEQTSTAGCPSAMGVGGYGEGKEQAAEKAANKAANKTANKKLERTHSTSSFHRACVVSVAVVAVEV